MVKLNSHSITPRHNRPGATGNTYLEFFYINNGAFSDPYEVSTVHIFVDDLNGDSSQYLTSAGHVGVSGHASSLMLFTNSGTFSDPNLGVEDVHKPAASGFNTARYGNDVSSASSIFKIGTGHFAVALKYGGLHSLGNASDSGADPVDDNYSDASATNKYFDIWTVRDFSTGELNSYVHQFQLYRDNTFSITEPLLVTTSHKLINKYVNKNSTVKLQITSEHTVNNKNITSEIKNIFAHSVIDNAAIRIIKLKDDTSTGVSYTQIQDWSDTSGSIQIDSEDTITYNWNTVGVDTGTYEIQASSVVLAQKIISDKFNLVVR